MNRKLMLMLAVVALTAAAVVGPTWADAYAGHGFSIVGPDGWTMQKDVNQTAVVFLNPTAVGDFRPNINVTVQDMTTTVDDYEKETAKEAASNNGKMLEMTHVTLHGKDGGRMHYIAAINGRQLEFLATFLPVGDKVYLVTGTANTEGFSANQAAFQHCEDTLRIL